MSDQYSWWAKALAVGKGRQLPSDEIRNLGNTLDPQSGFYRRRSYKDGPFVAVAIWRDEQGKLWCLQNGAEKECDDVMWSYCCRWPISEELYHSITNGGTWPDEPPAPSKDHNQRKTGDPAVDLREEYLAEKEIADRFLTKPIETQEDADKAAIWAKKIKAIVNSADAHFKTEKQPWLDGGKTVDDRYRWREDGAALSKKLKAAQEAFLKEQERLEMERRRKAQIEADRVRREAEKAAQEAEAAARAADEERARRDAAGPGVATLFNADANREADRLEQQEAAAKAQAERLAKQAADAEREAQARSVSAGRTGARVSLHTYYVANITDYDALLLALKDEPEVREAVEKIANRLARTKGAAMPVGSERVEDRRVA